MTPLHAIQKDRGCTVGHGCVGHECTCRRTVRLVLEGVREPSETMLDAVAGWPEHWPKEGPDYALMHAAYLADRHTVVGGWRDMIDLALKEVG